MILVKKMTEKEMQLINGGNSLNIESSVQHSSISTVFGQLGTSNTIPSTN